MRKLSVIFAALIAMSPMAHAELDPNNFWDTVSPPPTNEVYDAALKAQEYPAATGWVPEAKQNVTVRTLLTIISKSQPLIIDNLIVNRNNCKLYLSRGVKEITSGSSRQFVRIFKEITPPLNVTLQFGQQYKYVTDCTADQLLEVTMQTPTNPLTWNFNNY